MHGRGHQMRPTKTNKKSSQRLIARGTRFSECQCRRFASTHGFKKQPTQHKWKGENFIFHGREIASNIKVLRRALNNATNEDIPEFQKNIPNIDTHDNNKFQLDTRKSEYDGLDTYIDDDVVSTAWIAAFTALFETTEVFVLRYVVFFLCS